MSSSTPARESIATPPAVRFHHLDVLRAMLMLLGVVIHGAFVFTTRQTWLVASQDTHVAFDLVVAIIHAFRMPAFFLLSGYLFTITLRRSSTLPFMSSRYRRVLVPLVAAGLLLNVPQLAAFHWWPDTLGGANIGPRIACTSWSGILGGCWTIHLWFLVQLGYYMLLGLPVVRVLQRLPALRLPGPQSPLWVLTVLAIVAIGYATQLLSYRGLFGFVDYLPLVQDSARFHRYLPFFFFGILLGFAATAMASWRSLGPLAVLLLAASWFGFLHGFEPGQERTLSGVLGGRLMSWLYYAVALQTTAALVVLTARLKLGSAALSHYISDASYTVYLVHHLLVFLLAFWTAGLPIPLVLRFLVLVVLVGGLSIAFHHYVVRRSAVMRLLINGRSPAKTRPS